MSKKKLWLSIVAGVLAVAVLGACVVVPNLPKKEAYVYSFDMIGYVDNYSMGSESYGMVTTDRVQSVMLSPTQTVAEIFVYEGQHVRRGEKLYKYDTTLTDLEIERKELSIKQMEQNLKTAQAERKAMNSLKAMVIKDPDKNANQAGKSPTSKGPGVVYSGLGTKGSPYRVWLKIDNKNIEMSPEVFQDDILGYLEKRNDPGGNKGLENGDSVCVVFGLATKNKETYIYEYGVKYTYYLETEADSAAVVNPSDTVVVQPNSGTVPDPTTATEPEPDYTPEQVMELIAGIGEVTLDKEAAIAEAEQALASLSEEEKALVTNQQVLADARTKLDELKAAEPEKPTYTITQQFFQPTEEEDPNVILNSGYTSAEISAMKKEKDNEISERKFEIQVAKAELAIMKKEADSGEVYAEFDGVVESVLTPEEAREINAPLMKVTGGGGYYVEGSVSELDLGTIALGQTVEVTSWDNYMTYQGTIVDIGQYPTEQENYYGAANVSYYPYKVFIDESADLQEGYYVSMIYRGQDTVSDTGTMYLENAFVRTENGVSFVLVRNEEGLLEKRTVELGDTSGGYMSQILSGITETDWLAFPYGSEAVEGAPAVEGTWDNLYGY